MFLVMKEKNIFVYKPFLALNISDLSLYFCKNCKPPGKRHHLFRSSPLLKIEILSSTPLFENLGGGSAPTTSTHSSRKGRGGGGCKLRSNKTKSDLRVLISGCFLVFFAITTVTSTVTYQLI